MAVTLSGQKYLATINLPHMFSNVPVASQMFKIVVNSVTPFGGTINVLSRSGSSFGFGHSFWSQSNTQARLVLQLSGTNGTAQSQVLLTPGVPYVICLVWKQGKQLSYVSGVYVAMYNGNLTGNTSNRVDPVFLGPYVAQSAVVFRVSDLYNWDNYALTEDDVRFLTSNGDPTTIGSAATWRSGYSLEGTIGQPVIAGDIGLNNIFGTGGNFVSVNGSGTAVYDTPIVWAPVVTATPYVCGSGDMIGIYPFSSNIDGSVVIPSQLLVVPTIKINGVDQGPLVLDWGGHSTASHECMLFSTPGTPPITIAPPDIVEITAPDAWANTPSGSVGALSGVIDNRIGRSSVLVENMVKTIPMGLNHPAPGGLEYYPFINAKFKINNIYGYGKMPPGNGYEIVNQPNEAGEMLIVWDATNPSNPALASARSNVPTRVTVTHQPADDVTPSNGIECIRTYQISYVAGSDYETQAGGSSIGLNWIDPAYAGTPNYDRLFVYLPGEWTRDESGKPVFDRSDPFALSKIYLSRIPENIGSFRAVDMTCTGGACESFPDPELLNPPTNEYFWGYTPRQLPNVGFISIGPVDPAVTPYIYSAQFRESSCQYTATLENAITTTPAVGTHEVWHFSDGATAPLMARLEVELDVGTPNHEIVRILSGSGTDWTVYRGSCGTTPSTHAAGPVTVFGRQSIGPKVHADGTAPYTVPVFMTCNGPHGMTTMQGYYPTGVLPPILMEDGTTAVNLGLAVCYVTGPNTFVSIWSGYYPSKPNGTKPVSTTTLNPSVNYFQRLYYSRMPMEVYCNLVSKFPGADIHVNVPLDACDDLGYTLAWIVRDNYTGGGRVFVEYANEPWNWAPPFRANLYCTLDARWLMMPQSLNTYDLAYYTYRATRFHQIFREVFTKVGRGSQIKGIVNCQMGSGSNQVTPHLNLALQLGRPLDAVASAPYYSMNSSGQGNAVTVARFNAYTDSQACEQLLHDISYDPNGMIGSIRNIKGAIDSYNRTNNDNVIMIGYEGGIEYAAPTNAANHDLRSVDLQYDPGFFNVEQGWYKILQDEGFDRLHIYGLGIGWPSSWGVYHLRTQKHSRGDGLNGAIDNRLHCINPASPNYWTSSRIKRDLYSDSVRGEAFKNWLDTLNVSSGATAYTFSGPSSGMVGVASGQFTITPNGLYTGTITVTPSGGGLSTPVVLTFAGSSATQAFAITPVSSGTVTLTPTNSDGLLDPSPDFYTVNSTTGGGATRLATLGFGRGPTSITTLGFINGSSPPLLPPPSLSTSYTLTGPASGLIGVTSSPFTVTLDGSYTGTITVTPSGGGLSVPIVLTFYNSSIPQIFTITPVTANPVTLTATNSGGLTNPAAVLYDISVPPYATRIILKNSDVPGHQPAVADLKPGELAINTADVILYVLSGDGSSVVQLTSFGVSGLTSSNGSIQPVNPFPSLSAQNVITSTDDSPELIIRKIVGQTQPMTIWEDENGVEVAAILADGRIWGDGANIYNLDASNLAIGVITPNLLGSGTPDENTFLRGDNTWQPLPVSMGYSSVSKAYTVVDSDNGKVIELTGAVTVKVGALSDSFQHCLLMQMDAHSSKITGTYVGVGGIKATKANTKYALYEIRRTSDGTILFRIAT